MSFESNIKKINLIGIKNAASFWYPTMLAQEACEITESKAAELLGLTIPDYRNRKQEAIQAVLWLTENLPNPITGILVSVQRLVP